jgi:hypothetical protein
VGRPLLILNTPQALLLQYPQSLHLIEHYIDGNLLLWTMAGLSYLLHRLEQVAARICHGLHARGVHTPSWQESLPEALCEPGSC